MPEITTEDRIRKLGIAGRLLPTSTAGKNEIAERAERLKDAVRSAGGPSSVSRRAGVPLSTLNDALFGREMKVSFMVKVAGACGVSIEWLATGEGSPFRVLEPSVLKPPVKLNADEILAEVVSVLLRKLSA